MIPPLHADGPVDLVAHAELAPGNEFEEHLLVRGAGEAAVRERNGVLLAPAVGASAALASIVRRQERRAAAIEILRGPRREELAGGVAAAT